ncbi:hypothetical protein ccbrp13_30430 [Ktedonobacteria bacterium brp13]|nr:hypothetical protein ccbrp13_30430 [Ktedonobacteria bacterium brp13]
MAQALARAVVIVEELASALTNNELHSHFLASSQMQDLFTLPETQRQVHRPMKQREKK